MRKPESKKVHHRIPTKGFEYWNGSNLRAIEILKI
jgi:hypothetical protein